MAVTVSAISLVMMLTFTVVTGTFSFNAAAVALFVTVLMTALMMMSAGMTFTVMLVVMIAARIRIILQRTRRKRLCRFIRRTFYAGVQPDTGFCDGCPSHRADPAAKQDVRFCRFQKTCKSAVMDAVGVNDLFVHDPSFLDVVQFELLRLAEMLENFSVLIGDCDSHDGSSFPCDFLLNFKRFIFTATADDQQLLSVNKHIRNLFPRAVINRRDGGSGNMHPCRTFLLRQSVAVQKLDRLKLVNGHPNGFGIRNIIRGKTAIYRHLPDFSVFDRSRHRISFLTYVYNYDTRVFVICQLLFSQEAPERNAAQFRNDCRHGKLFLLCFRKIEKTQLAVRWAVIFR